MDCFVENGFLVEHYAHFTKEDVYHFKDFWNDLVVDQYITDNFKYRHRRYSKLLYDHDGSKVEFLSSTYLQEFEHNHLFGGESRQFEALDPAFLDHPIFLKYLIEDFHFFLDHRLLVNKPYEMGVHQMRTVCEPLVESQVTPEGIHKDGHFAFAIHFVDSENISGGVTRLYNNDKEIIARIQLNKFGQTMYIEDDKLFHEVTPIKTITDSQQGYRDILIIEFY